MIYKGHMKGVDKSSSLSGRNARMNVTREKMGSKHMFKCMGRNGKVYTVITHKTDKGAYVGTEIFPRMAVKVIWSKDDRLTVQVRSLKTKAKTSYRKRKSYGDKNWK